MKFARIFLAFIMFTAIIFRSLPDSVFNYFHSHKHYSTTDHDKSTGDSIGDYKHNCQIEDWNFESFEAIDNNYVPVQQSAKKAFTFINNAQEISFSISQIGRGPPVS